MTGSDKLGLDLAVLWLLSESSTNGGEIVLGDLLIDLESLEIDSLTSFYFCMFLFLGLH